jgi:hypothetical protein
MLLYLVTDVPGPRITDEAWKMLWYRVLRADRESAAAMGLRAGMGALSVSGGSSHSSRSGTPALIANAYPSPASPATSVSNHDSRRPSESCDSSDSQSQSHPYALPSPSPSMHSLGMPATGDLFPAAAFNFSNAGALPILAKVEFDIDKRKASWYEPWRQRRRQRAQSTASTSTTETRTRELVLGRSGGIDEAKRHFVATTHIPPPAIAQIEVEIQQPKPQAAFVMQVDRDDDSEYGDEENGSGGSPGGYLPLPDAEQAEEEEENTPFKSPLTVRALRRESMIPLDLDLVVPNHSGGPESSDNEAEDAHPTVTRVSVVQEQEEQDEESDYDEETAVMDGEQLLRDGKDPLADVFPSDEKTWAEMANSAPSDAHGPHKPELVIPELVLGGGMVPPSATYEISGSDLSDGGDIDSPEDVIALWKAKHEPKIDEPGSTLPAHPPANMDKSLPPSPTEPQPLIPPLRKGSMAKHIPPPLVLTPSAVSNSPQVIIAPPSAGLESSQGRSYLAYLDEKKDTDAETPPTEEAMSRAPLPGIEAIEILVNEPSGTVFSGEEEEEEDEPVFGGVRSAFTDHSSSEGHSNELARSRAGSLVSEEHRSRALDELEKVCIPPSPPSVLCFYLVARGLIGHSHRRLLLFPLGSGRTTRALRGVCSQQLRMLSRPLMLLRILHLWNARGACGCGSRASTDTA